MFRGLLGSRPPRTCCGPAEQDLKINNNNLINRHSVAGRTRTVARTVGSDQGQYTFIVASAVKGGRQEGQGRRPLTSDGQGQLWFDRQ